MPNIARTNKRSGPPAPVTTSPGKTKILLVRQPVKSVRRSDEPDRAMFHLMIGVISAVGMIAVIWFLGLLGFSLGYAQSLGVPELNVDAWEGLTIGAMMLIGLPNVLLQAGISEPGYL